MPLGRASALDAVRALSRPGATPERGAKEVAALVRLVVMTSEALRWKPIREAFGGDWESEIFITREQAELVPRWVDLSYLVFRWEATGARGEEKAWRPRGSRRSASTMRPRHFPSSIFSSGRESCVSA
ncbi:hypothetical protein PAHAL_9G133400 [Panicum hallii]|jgi:hypothetical protein|uniref:rRNA N-glycosylase n=1 Tax=Panicum hallii TaxID=206008 RepID=A0A2T8I163_9POAL|nr:uncharacterized protein LOC112877685 [Panicum hallii]PVH31393.1 hypothetical protein PAHAL_9G133400 [Panicum hallii]